MRFQNVVALAAMTQFASAANSRPGSPGPADNGKQPATVPGTSFKWIDSSCKPHIDAINKAVIEVQKMTQAAKDSLEGRIDSESTDPDRIRITKTYKLFFGEEPNDPIGISTRGRFNKISRVFDQASINMGLYCDGSAFKFVDTFQEDHTPPEGKGHKLGEKIPRGGYWHATRRPPGEDPFYIRGTDRPDLCKFNGQDLEGVSVPKSKYIVICPKTWEKAINDLVKIKEEAPELVSLDRNQSPGVVMQHEAGHALIELPAVLPGGRPEAYGYNNIVELAKASAPAAQGNADTWALFAMAMFFDNYDFSDASDPVLSGFGKPIKQPAPAERRAAEPLPEAPIVARNPQRRPGAGAAKPSKPSKPGRTSKAASKPTQTQKPSQTRRTTSPAPKSTNAPGATSAPASRSTTPSRISSSSSSSSAAAGSASPSAVSSGSSASGTTPSGTASATSDASASTRKGFTNVDSFTVGLDPVDKLAPIKTAEVLARLTASPAASGASTTLRTRAAASARGSAAAA